MKSVTILLFCLSSHQLLLMCSALVSEIPSISTPVTVPHDLLTDKESTPVSPAVTETSSISADHSSSTPAEASATTSSEHVTETGMNPAPLHYSPEPQVKSFNLTAFNFTQLQNYTQTLGQQIKNLLQRNVTKSSDEGEGESEDSHGGETEAHETQDVHIQDLLRGILVDEFGSIDEESAESADSEESNVFFHDDSDEEPDSEEDEDKTKEEETTASSSGSSFTSTSTSSPSTSTLKVIAEDEAEIAKQEDTLEETKAELDADIVIERTSRSDISFEKDEEQEEDHTLTKSSRARNPGREQQGSGAGNVNKYNRYVDAVFKRMNSLIRAKRMDPLRVNLYAGSNANNATHHHNNNNNGGGNDKHIGNGNNKNNGNGVNGQGGKSKSKNKNNGNKNNGPKNKKNNGGAAGAAGAGQGKRPGNKNRNNTSNNNNNNHKNNKRGKNNHNRNQQHNNKRQGNTRPRLFQDEEVQDETHVHGHSHRRGRAESTSEKTIADNKMRPSSLESKANKTTMEPSSTSTEQSTATSGSIPTSTSASESKEMKGESNSNSSNNRPTRGVLHGLSTLRRAGPVKVIRQGPNVRLVRAKFLLGPVALDILPKKAGNSSKSSNAATATATARSLKGVLEIRLKNSGPTRIRRLRVFPPSNVRVEGETNGMKKQGYRKITPVAARRLMSVANQVVRQSDNSRNPPKAQKKNNKNKNKNKPAKNNIPRNTVKRNNKVTRTRPHPHPHRRF